MWINSLHGHFYRKIEPTVSWQIKYKHKNRNKKVIISRLRLGKCCVNEYLAMMKVAECDQGSSRTVTHGNAVPVLFYTTGTSFPLFFSVYFDC